MDNLATNATATGRRPRQNPADACDDNLFFAHAYKAACRRRISDQFATGTGKTMQLTSRVTVATPRLPGTPVFRVLAIEEKSHIGVVNGGEFGSPTEFS